MKKQFPPGCPKARKLPVAGDERSLLGGGAGGSGQGAQIDFDAAILRAAIGGGVAGDGGIGTGAPGAQARRGYALGGQVAGNVLRPALGQLDVVGTAAGAVGVADDLDAVLIELDRKSVV